MFQDSMSTKEEDNFSCSFRNAIHHALSSKFENVRQLKPVQEEALLQFIKQTGQTRLICTFAVYFSVFRPFSRFTLVYEGHFVLCYKEKTRAVRSC